MGCAIIAMESLGYPSEKIREAVREMDAAMDLSTLKNRNSLHIGCLNYELLREKGEREV